MHVGIFKSSDGKKTNINVLIERQPIKCRTVLHLLHCIEVKG